MINNRQGGRRRGRGGQRGQNLGGQPGNRQDNRQRGNAAQLLEKYKSMARDAQLVGRPRPDRILSPVRGPLFPRAEREPRALRGTEPAARRQRDDEFEDDDGGEEELVEAGEGETSEADERQDRRERQERQPRRDREPRRFNREERGANEDDQQSEQRPRLNGGVTAFRSMCFRRRSAPTKLPATRKLLRPVRAAARARRAGPTATRKWRPPLKPGRPDADGCSRPARRR